jgi:AraC-like DNA-binding protein
MQPKYHQVPKTIDKTFSIRHDIVPSFGTIWHYHPEIELHYLIKGNGIRFIGENINNFEEDELILLGSNIPHTWKCNVQNNNEEYVEALVMHIHPESLGSAFLSLPEAKKTRKIFSLANQGLLYYGETKIKAIKLMRKLAKASDLNRIILLLKLLDLLSISKEYEIISSQYDNNKINTADEKRLNKILNYTFSHFKSKIIIEDVAELSNLSVTSFCRYFKSATQKSYFDFLTDIRINYACRLLVNSEQPVKAIAEDSGFENVSNFYRHFKRYKNSTPNVYKKDYLENS